MNSITYRDHLGRQVVESQLPAAKSYIQEATHTKFLDCRWLRFISPQFANHLDNSDPFFTCSTESRNKVISIEEAKMQIARAALGIFSDQVDQISANGESFTRCKMRTHQLVPLDSWERPWRFSATKLADYQVAEEQIKEVAHLFFLEAALNANLMAPESLNLLKGFENHVFHAVSGHIVVGLPICFIEVSLRSVSQAKFRKDRLLQIFKEIYPSKLCRDVEESFNRGKWLRNTFYNIYKREDRTPIQKLAVMEMKLMGLRGTEANFFECCGALFQRMLDLSEVGEDELNEVRFKFLEILAFGGKSHSEICDILKIYLNESYPRRYFSAYDLFMEMYGNKILNNDFLIPRMFVISLEKNEQIVIQKMDSLFSEFGNKISTKNAQTDTIY